MAQDWPPSATRSLIILRGDWGAGESLVARQASILIVGLFVVGLFSGCLDASKILGPVVPPEEDLGQGVGPQVVIAHIDTGINPYHKAFRWEAQLSHLHPSKYIAGYPATARELRLSLDAPDLPTALQQDKEVWAGVQRGELYWISGTRIVGAITFGPGGRLCPHVAMPPANQLVQKDCPERPILDDFGHGTMTASRMAGATHSLAPEGLIVSIEGDETKAVPFIANAGWIDVVSNSWGYLTPTATELEMTKQVELAARRALFVFASGNGLGFLNGVVGQPTYYMPTGTPSVLLVGAHDNGYLTAWHGAPVHVVADGYGGWRAARDHMEEMKPSPESCCTSTAAPYAAGGAAALILEARKILGDSRTGLRGVGDAGVFAEGPSGRVASGPLADGKFTLAELKTVYERTADPRPPVTAATEDDGLLHWTATPGAKPSDPWLGDNPYCVGCWTSPVPLKDVPTNVNLVYNIGYGAVTRASTEAGKAVLSGQQPIPSRPVEDQFFSADATLRELVQPK